MGWSSGTYVMEEIIALFKKHVPDKEVRKTLYKGVIDTLEGQDWDCQAECKGMDAVYDEALRELHPDED